MRFPMVLLLGLTVFSLVGLFYLLKPVAPPVSTGAQNPPLAAADPELATPSPQGDVAPAANETAVPEQLAARYVLRNGQLVSGPQRISVRRGQQVNISIDTDSDDELHVHGYDLHLNLQAGEPATLGFVADKTGRFELELHQAHQTLAALEVHP